MLMHSAKSGKTFDGRILPFYYSQVSNKRVSNRRLFHTLAK
jgi:hypothetical protein